MSKITVSLDDIESTTRLALVKHGAAPWVADEVARAVRKAEATGNIICGLYYLESYCKQLTTGRVMGAVEPIVTRPKTASVKVDAKFGFAQSAFIRGLAEAIGVVQEAGTCSLAICHSHTCTSLGYFTEQIAEAGFIGIGFTNASAVVSPPGVSKSTSIASGKVCVWPGMLETKVIVAPNSPIPLAKPNTAPANSPGAIDP